jgi:hypothetical protein
MGAMSIRARVSGPVAMLRRLSAKLQRLQIGGPAEATAEIVGDELGDDIVAALGPHIRSGASASTMLVQRSAKGVKVIAAYYLKFHPAFWDITHTNTLPSRYADRAKVVFKEQVHNLLSG